MQALAWILRFAVLLLIVWFASKNAQPVRINGLLEQSWQSPLVFVMLVAFVAGIVIGLAAWVPTVVRQRREIGRLKKTANRLAAMSAPPAVAPGTEPPAVEGPDKGAPDKGVRGPAHGV
jgi:uncharacterized integral membrane protein